MKHYGLLLALCLTSTQCYANDTIGIWTSYKGNAAQTGYANVNVDPAKLHVLWTKAFSEPGDTWGKFTYPAITTNHLVYFSMSAPDHPVTPNAIYALNPATGETVWHTIVQDSDFLSGPVYGNGKIYVTQFNGDTNDSKGYVRAFDAKTGAAIYTKPLALYWYNTYSMPTFYNDHLYVSHSTQQYSIDAASGNVDWSVNAGDNNDNTLINNDYLIRQTPEGIDVLNRQTGSGKTSIIGMTAADSYVLASPVLDEKNKTVYAALTPADMTSTQGNWIPTQLTAFDIEQKLVKWKLTMPAIMAIVLADDNKLYVTSDNKLYEVDAVTGNINWFWQAPKSDYSIHGIIVTTDVIFAAGGKTFAISRKTHEKIWESNISGMMSADNNNLYIVHASNPSVVVTAITLN